MRGVGMDYNASSSLAGANGRVVELDIPSNITCHPLNIPSIQEYFTAFNEWGVALFTLGGLAVLIVLALYVDTMRTVIQHAPTSSKAHTAFVISVYPVVSIATYIATIVPRAQLLAEALTQGMFMACLYQLFCLFISYCGGEAQLINKVHPNLLSLQVAPCCCWPCFSFCLPTFPVTKKVMLTLRILVLQLPVVQGLIYVIFLVMWAEEQSLYQVNHNYFLPIMITSILTGIWGMVMTTKMLIPVLPEHKLQGKFLVLQLVLVLAKFQGLAAKAFASGDFFPCRHPITPTVYTNLVYNSVLLWEMVLLSSLARSLYEKPMPTSYHTDSNSNVAKPISAIIVESKLNDLNAVRC
ncbi:Hypothetical protein NTJ_05721 [Nesidiocoris tenuis]|uniref:Organic solute transporter alpha-like protein n=1 Tax=Nesidiocoris tenuis TaxID=355587 RepID=A0ABN7ANP9_9HEMI|nr:Hypothetical protein NTJ_05721 [Nesidiocoris tenuis]